MSNASIEHRGPAKPAARPWEDYLRALVACLDQSEKDLPQIARLADGVADRFIARQVILAGGPQAGFVSELIGRASGLAALNGFGKPAELDAQVVMLATDPRAAPEVNVEWLRAAAAKDAQVVLFSNAEELKALPVAPGEKPFAANGYFGLVDNHVGARQFSSTIPGAGEGRAARAPLASVVNIINAWIFVGELAAACVRRGRMPNFYLAFLQDDPRNYERALRYRNPPSNPEGRVTSQKVQPQAPFHEKCATLPIEREWVGRRYLEHLHYYITQLLQWGELQKVSDAITRKLRENRSVHLIGIGHNMPAEVPEAERGTPFVLFKPKPAAGESWDSLGRWVKEEVRPGDMLVLLCMPPYEENMTSSALENGLEVIALSTTSPVKAHRANPKVRWFAMPWPYLDGCVELPGYDIPILPVTGVMNPAIYYALRCQVEYDLGRGGK